MLWWKVQQGTWEIQMHVVSKRSRFICVSLSNAYFQADLFVFGSVSSQLYKCNQYISRCVKKYYEVITTTKKCSKGLSYEINEESALVLENLPRNWHCLMEL